MRLPMAVALLLVLAACGKGTEPTSASLTGTWLGTPALLGVQALTLTLTETSSQFTGTGTFTPTTGSASGTVTLSGIRIANQLQVTMQIHSATGDANQVFTGIVETADRFYLLFPGGTAGALRVPFQRQ